MGDGAGYGRGEEGKGKVMSDPIMNVVGELLEGLRDEQDNDVYVHQLVDALRGAGPEDVGRIIVEAFKAMAKSRAELTDMVVDRTRWASPVPIDMGRNCPVAPAMNVTLTYLAHARSAEVRDAVNKALVPRLRREGALDSYPGWGPYQVAATRSAGVDVLQVAKAFEAARDTRRLVAEIERQAALAMLSPAMTMGIDAFGADGYPRDEIEHEPQRRRMPPRIERWATPVPVAALSERARALVAVEPEADPFVIRPTPDEASRFREVLGFGDTAPAPADDGVWLVTPADLRETREAKGLGTGEVMGWGGYEDE